jgi:hypothetical protein
VKNIAPFLWIALAIGALIYWSSSADHPTNTSPTVVDNSDKVSTASSAADEDSGDASTDESDTFHGDPCTVDCSGHQAGYDWAEQHDIDDEDDCGGNSESFIEGCKAYVREQQGMNVNEHSDDSEETDDN